MALVAYDDSDSEDNGATEDDYRPAVVSKKITTEKQTVKIGLPFSNLVSELRQSRTCICLYVTYGILEYTALFQYPFISIYRIGQKFGENAKNQFGEIKFAKTLKY